MEEIFYRFNPWWEEEYNPDFIDREKYTNKFLKSLNNKDIEIITGLRRIGKTTIMKLLIKKLINELNVNPKYIFYISLDFYGFEKKTVLEIVEEYMKIQQISFKEKVYIFLDEVAYVKDFSKQLKNLYDLYNAKIFATSSSSSILKDKKAYLTGRERLTEVLPLDFQEFLNFKKIILKKSDYHLLEPLFENYMALGGLPQYVLTEDVEYIKQLVDDIIYKDIITYHNVKESGLIKEFFYMLMERSGKQISLNKLAKILGISVDTARRYFDYFVETYLVYPVVRCGKLNERLKSPKKIYTGDVGIRNIITGLRDKGAVFENIVFLSIKHKNPCYIYQDGIEIDFLTQDKILIEVKYNAQLNEKQRKLFESYSANKKIIIDSVEKFFNLENLV